MSMEIRVASPADKNEIVELALKSQLATRVPPPALVPPESYAKSLYERDVIERYVAVAAGQIVCHGLIQEVSPHELHLFQAALQEEDSSKHLAQLGADFVDPAYAEQGIWTSVLELRLRKIREDLLSIPVSATWTKEYSEFYEHIKRKYEQYGGREIGELPIPEGQVALFVFD